MADHGLECLDFFECIDFLLELSVNGVSLSSHENVLHVVGFVLLLLLLLLLSRLLLFEPSVTSLFPPLF